MRFLRWRIWFLGRSIRKLDLRLDRINTFFQVSDLKNSPGPGKRELRIATRQTLQLLQDNYPEFVARESTIMVSAEKVISWRGNSCYNELDLHEDTTALNQQN